MKINSLVGKKIYQKQGFLEDGTRVPLTGVVVSGNLITQIKSENKEGYNALQLGIGNKTRAAKRELGQSKKAGLEKAARFFREIKVDDLEGAVLGSELNILEIFQPGDIVDVTGTSKGKGWAGGVKRWGFHGGPRTHGQSDRERAPGSIGQTTTPGRVYKGKKMAGRMGSDTVTLKNLEIIEITADGVLLIKGLVPGSINSIVVVKKIGENKKFVPLYKEAADLPAQVEEPVETPVEEAMEASEPVGEVKAEETAEVKEEAEAKEVQPDLPASASEALQVGEVKEEIKEENANS